MDDWNSKYYKVNRSLDDLYYFNDPIKEGSDISSVHIFRYTFPFRKLLQKYESNMYEIHQSLINGIELQDNTIAKIDEMFADAPVTTIPMTVYRGISKDVEFNIADVIVFPQYLWTSLILEYAEEYLKPTHLTYLKFNHLKDTGTMFKITIPIGTQCVDRTWISHANARNYYCNEIIFHRGSSLTVTNINEAGVVECVLNTNLV